MRLTKFALFLLAIPCFAATTYLVTVDASSLPPATTGFIDFTFNGGYPATAIVSNFSDAGGLLNAGSIFTQGTVSGTLPGTVTLGDDNADYDEGITYGSHISFLLTLTGTPSGNTGNVFNLSLFDTNFDGLLTGNVNDGWIVQFQQDTQGNVTTDAFVNPAGGPSFATITPVPEPVEWSFVAAGLLGCVYRRRARKEPPTN